MSRRINCRVCTEPLTEDEFEYCDPCLLEMEDADDNDEDEDD